MIGIANGQFGLLVGGAMVQLNGPHLFLAPLKLGKPGLKLWHRFLGERVFKLQTSPWGQIQFWRQKRAGHGLRELAIHRDDKSKITQARD